MRSSVLLNINGKDVTIENADPEMSLAYFLRNEIALTGCKIACEEGSCGACTVVIAYCPSESEKPKYTAVNACMYPLYLTDGKFVITVEGIGNKSKIHEVQKRLALSHGTQCGYCSPGFVMSMYALLMDTDGKPTIHQINQAIKGNLCRCTGYRPILEAFYSFESNGCCKEQTGCPCKINSSPSSPKPPLDFPILNETQNLVFPSSLKLMPKKEGLLLKNDRTTLVVPTSIAELFNIHKTFLDSNTGTTVKFLSTGMITRFASFYKSNIGKKWISIAKIPELQKSEVTSEFVIVRAAQTIRQLVEAVYKFCDPPIASAFKAIFDNYSSQQIFNFASWAGALCGTNISDLQVICSSLQVNVGLVTPDGSFMKHAVDNDMKTLIPQGYLLKEIYIPLKLKGKMFAGKFGDRVGPDTTELNYSIVLEGSETISKSNIYFSDRKTIVKLRKLENFISSKNVSLLHHHCEDVFAYANEDLKDNIEDYKCLLARGIFKNILDSIQSTCDSEITSMEKAIKSTQLYTKVSDEQDINDDVGRANPHISSELSSTGEAIFHGDLQFKGMIHLSFVLSNCPKGKILSTDSSHALALSGVIGYFDITNIPKNGNNFCKKSPLNHIYDDTPILADKRVEYVGQPIGIIAATHVEIARRAAALVIVEYEQEDAIYDFQAAIQSNSYHGSVDIFGKEQAEVDNELKKSELVLEGEINLGGQQHIYMEPQTAIAYPGDHNEIVVYSSTQAMSIVQQMTSLFLGLPANKVVIKVKRLGGAFGGKVSQSIAPACYSALIALLLRRPVSCVYSRKEDFLITGGRHPAYWKYKVGVDKTGQIRALHLKCYIDAGAFIDSSKWVTYATAGVAGDACYKIPIMRSEGYTVKTNTTSNTAMRGFGQPQAYYAFECILNHISFKIGKDLHDVKFMNLNQQGSRTNLGNLIINDSMLDAWEELLKFSKFEERKKDIDSFNRENENVQKGISISSVRFGLPHGGCHEQATALVQIYVDGSVAVSIGGIEMGQGLQTKILQITSRALKVPVDYINVMCGSTDKTANAPETGGSQGTDLHGKAVQAACSRLREGIDPLRENDKSWCEVILEAYHKKLPLQATEVISIDRKKYGVEENKPCYFTSGAACVIVEVDCLTGNHTVESVDIVMDVGKSINPMLDIGQIEGGFLQGYGQFVSESTPKDKQNGRPLIYSIEKYKAPTSCMVPKEFRVKLLKEGSVFPEQVYSSKGIGEPPLILSVAVYSAILQALQAYRAQKEWIQHDAPLTREKILHILHGSQ